MKSAATSVRTLVLYTGCAALLAILTACESMQRSRSSGYQNHDVPTSREQAAAASSWNRDSYDDVDATTMRVYLDRAEKALEGKREREQYFKNKPYMRSDRDRLDFLALSSYEERQKWLAAKGIQLPNMTFPPQIQSLIDVNDIAIGMPKQAVKDSWGEPESVEVAGNPIYGNERWRYAEQTSSTEGYHSQNRVVYFESGRVVGWETH